MTEKTRLRGWRHRQAVARRREASGSSSTSSSGQSERLVGAERFPRKGDDEQPSDEASQPLTGAPPSIEKE
jgi:hypothetical protein